MNTSKTNSLTVVIAALNEERNIAQTISSVNCAAIKVPELRLEIIVVDDGSTDRTDEIVQELAKSHDNLRLLKNPKNIGLGASIRRAIGEARMDKIIFIPGDNDIPTFTLDLLFANVDTADLVMTYFHNDECRGRVRYLVSTFFRLIYTTIFDLYVLYINGPAIYPAKELKQLSLHSTRFSIVAEINVKLLRRGLSFVELPSYRQVGLEDSTSASWRSFVETAYVFVRLVVDIYVRTPEEYLRRPKRIPYVFTLKTLNQDMLKRPGKMP